MKPAKILHLHSTFNLGGKEARAVRLMNHFGEAAEHVILSAQPDNLSARDAINGNIKVGTSFIFSSAFQSAPLPPPLPSNGSEIFMS